MPGSSGLLLDQAAEKVTRSQNGKWQAGVEHAWSQKVFPIQRQERRNLSLQGSRQDVGILGNDDQALGGNLLWGRRLHQLEVEGGNVLVEPEEGISPEFVLDVPLGLPEDETAAYSLDLAMPAQGQDQG